MLPKGLIGVPVPTFTHFPEYVALLGTSGKPANPLVKPKLESIVNSDKFISPVNTLLELISNFTLETFKLFKFVQPEKIEELATNLAFD